MRSHRRAALLAVAAAALLGAMAGPAAASAGAARSSGTAAGWQPPPVTTTTPFQTPDTSSCPYRSAPPAPVDLSEAPAPGVQVPGPLPVRERAVGGERMAECGLVMPGGASGPPADLTPYSWLIADLDNGAVLAARDPHGRHRAASTIKILTALVAIRELDLASEVIGTEEDASQEGSRVGMGPGGVYTVSQLLHGLLMRSGNDAAHALAVRLGGEQATVRKMDALARELGALDTRVATPSGLDGPGASTSAYDLALIFRVAMHEPAFATIMGATLADFPGFQDKPGFKVANDNRLLANYPGALGGKTGFTDDARHTYVGAAQRDGRRLLVVMLRGEQEPVRMWEQAARLLDFGFALPADVKPVGVLVDEAPPETTGTSGPVARQAAGAASTAGDTATGGNRMSYVTAVAAVLTLAIAIAWALLRRRRSPAP